MVERRPSDCCCAPGAGTRCHVCVVALAHQLRLEHPDNLSVSMLRRRIGNLDGYTAAVLVEATRRMARPRRQPVRLMSRRTA